MALQSPGVQVTVIDESFYTPAEPGTVPLIVVATGQDKLNGAGTAIASATTKANAGKAFKLTSQKDLLDLFGTPFFEKTASANPIHGGERNEYGLLAAYSLLGVSNAAFLVRADVDLDQLEAQADAPGSNPANGAWWVNTQASSWGIQEWNGASAATTGGQKFSPKTPAVVLTDNDTAKVEDGAPKASVGSIGDYAIVFQTAQGAGGFSVSRETARLYFKSAGNGGAGALTVAAGTWVLVGSTDWKASWPTIIGSTITGAAGTGVTLSINGTSVTVQSDDTLDDVKDAINDLTIPGIGARVLKNMLYIYSNGEHDAGDSAARNDSVVIAGSNLGNIGLSAGTYYAPRLVQAPHTQVPQWKLTGAGQTARPTGSVWIKTTEPNQGARIRVSRWNTGTTSWVAYEAPMYASTNAATYYLDRAGGGLNLNRDVLFTQTNANENSGDDLSPETAEFRFWRRAIAANTSTTVLSNKIGTTGGSFTISESLKDSLTMSAPVSVTGSGANAAAIAESLATDINSKGFVNIVASVVEDGSDYKVQISHKLGGDFRLSAAAGDFFTPYDLSTGVGSANLYNLSVLGNGGQAPLTTGSTDGYLASGWQPLSAQNFDAAPDAPLNEPTNGQLWYNMNFSEVDIMVHNGNTWVGYRHESSPYYGDSEETRSPSRLGFTPIVAASNPFVTGVTATGDLWISTADLENYPTIYKYDNTLTDLPAENRWVLVDKTDQTTESGILFADARWAITGASTAASSIRDLATVNYLDPDAPDPALYPRGMMLWNLRRSGGNVKKYVNNYIDPTADNPRTSQSGGTWLGQAFVDGSGEGMSGYWSDRWVTASANNEDGSGTFGRWAQRKVVVQALKSAIDTSQEARDEERRNFNLIACPGYPETMSNLVNLNIDRGVTAFVIGDTPLRLPSDATSLTTWGTNANLVTDNGDDGIVTYDEYMAVFYPNGFTTDLGGSNAVVPASHMMLKTIALSDNVSYPWFAPAGTRRGGITNATAVGYIDSLSGEFQTVALNEGQRDTLYDLKINPITFFNGVGLVNYGQKTRARNASALDRINVARLVVYLRSQLNKLARPYIFEPNDKITRDEIKQAVESLLLELVGLRALYDFAVVCDESNNTPARVDRNELWVDIAIEPVKAVEFIYIPLRVKNTGEI